MSSKKYILDEKTMKIKDKQTESELADPKYDNCVKKIDIIFYDLIPEYDGSTIVGYNLDDNYQVSEVPLNGIEHTHKETLDLYPADDNNDDLNYDTMISSGGKTCTTEDFATSACTAGTEAISLKNAVAKNLNTTNTKAHHRNNYTISTTANKRSDTPLKAVCFLGKDPTERAKEIADINTNLTKCITAITNRRIETYRITPTTNNPVSSRAHLFIEVIITDLHGATSKIVVCDMAGSEYTTNKKTFFPR